MNKSGGGNNANKNGLKFEQDTSLESALISKNFKVNDRNIYKDGTYIGKLIGQDKLYYYLKDVGIDYTKINSKKYKPDEAFLNEKTKTVYIVEKKFQSQSGSVDEKLQTCDFKKMVYQRLFKKLGYKIEYMYVFNDWFKKPQYDDVKKYIVKKKCKYFFYEIPLCELGLE